MKSPRKVWGVHKVKVFGSWSSVEKLSENKNSIFISSSLPPCVSSDGGRSFHTRDTRLFEDFWSGRPQSNCNNCNFELRAVQKNFLKRFIKKKKNNKDARKSLKSDHSICIIELSPVIVDSGWSPTEIPDLVVIPEAAQKTTWVPKHGRNFCIGNFFQCRWSIGRFFGFFLVHLQSVMQKWAQEKGMIVCE